jgi:hypothetical protein
MNAIFPNDHVRVAENFAGLVKSYAVFDDIGAVLVGVHSKRTVI